MTCSRSLFDTAQEPLATPTSPQNGRTYATVTRAALLSDDGAGK